MLRPAPGVTGPARVDRPGERPEGQTFGGGAPDPGVNELPLDEPEFAPIPGQWWPLRRAPAGGAAGFAVDVVDVDGVVGAELVVVDEDEAAFASAAPPPATAAVTTTVLRAVLIRIWVLTSLSVSRRRFPRKCVSFVGER
jgi:hypothetical protein